jgi:hypothetical protein
VSREIVIAWHIERVQRIRKSDPCPDLVIVRPITATGDCGCVELDAPVVLQDPQGQIWKEGTPYDSDEALLTEWRREWQQIAAARQKVNDR